MKRFLGILVCVFVFSGCDDGDLIVDTINFDEVQTSTCSDNNLLFKLKESESLILNIPENSFTQDATINPTKLTINTTNQVVYNFYDGKVETKKICDLIDPGIPNVNTQWNATSGIIEITTEVQKTFDEIKKSSQITGYKNVIVFRNITFTKKDGTTQFYDEFPFGDYLQPKTKLPFAFKQVLHKCNNDLVYNFTDNESLTLNIDPTLIENVPTALDQPRTGVIGLDKNKLVYRFYEGLLLENYFCQSTDPETPIVIEEWLGKAGGIIEVTTTSSGVNSFKHTIVLKNVSLVKGNSDFQLGSDYKYGDLTTTK
jgi:hypothetical protein